MTTRTNRAIRAAVVLLLIMIWGVGCQQPFSEQVVREKHIVVDKLTVKEGGAEVGSGAEFTDHLQVAAPTTIATATPAALINSLGVSNILEVQDASTPVWAINDGGDVVQSGARTASGGDTVNSWVKVAVPTAQATATPGVVIDSAGIANPFEVRIDATPVFQIQDDGRFEFDGAAAGALDMGQFYISNIGNTGTDFTAGTGGLNLAGDLDLAALLQLSFADLAVSDGDTITPTVTVYALDTTGAVTITLAASADEGQLLVLINDDANATIIEDTNLRSSDGNAITLAGAYDVAVFIYQDSEWLELLTIADS